MGSTLQRVCKRDMPLCHSLTPLDSEDLMRKLDLALWIAYAAFVAIAVAAGWHDQLLTLSGPAAAGKAVVSVVWVAFLAYSVHATRHESLFSTIRKMNALYWGRQIGTDLYLGLGLFLGLIYLNEGAGVAALWLVPVVLFANLATLPYVIIHYEQLVSRFVGA